MYRRFAALVLLLGTCSQVETLAAAQAEQDALDLGRRVYNYRCYFCHGYSGDARTTASEYLDPKPRDFTSLDPASVSRESMVATLTKGRAGTAMQSYAAILSRQEIDAVVDFVRRSFVTVRSGNTRYHTAANGWPQHERYAAAFPFVIGEITLEQPVERLTPVQREGRVLYQSACVTCHDRRPRDRYEIDWVSRPLSYPLHGDTPTNHPTDAGFNQYRVHAVPPKLSSKSALEKEGEALYQANCAFCHAADGTGKNWIGAFMEPPARDLTGNDLVGITRERIEFVVREGLPGTSMPAWKTVLKPREIQAIAAYVFRAFRLEGQSAGKRQSARQ